jgi:DNA-directed RNA polymerase specialized sigma24 family protein
MSSSTLPLFPTDDGWPYPDAGLAFDPAADAPDLDALELLGPHAFDCLSDDERRALVLHFGLEGTTPLSMKELGPALGCSRADAREQLGRAIDKLRVRFTSA